MFPSFHKWEAPNHPFFVGIFQQINHPAIGVLPFMEAPMCDVPTAQGALRL